MRYFILKVGLEAEYQEIRNRDPTGTFYHARMSANVLKNRYTDVPSYDHSRVVLATEQSDNKEDEDSGDFINANFVDGCVRLSTVSKFQDRTGELKFIICFIDTEATKGHSSPLRVPSLRLSVTSGE